MCVEGGSGGEGGFRRRGGSGGEGGSGGVGVQEERGCSGGEGGLAYNFCTTAYRSCGEHLRRRQNQRSDGYTGVQCGMYN